MFDGSLPTTGSRLPTKKNIATVVRSPEGNVEFSKNNKAAELEARTSSEAKEDSSTSSRPDEMFGFGGLQAIFRGGEGQDFPIEGVSQALAPQRCRNCKSFRRTLGFPLLFLQTSSTSSPTIQLGKWRSSVKVIRC